MIVSDYIKKLCKEVVSLRLDNSSYEKAKAANQPYMATVPLPLSRSAGAVNKEDVVAAHRSRFNQR